jgi:hypothetical protein
MKKLNTLKTLPIIGLLAIGVAMVPAVSQAAPPGALGSALSHDGGKGHHRDGGKGHRDYGKSHGRDKGRYDRGHGHKGYAKGHDRGHKRVYNYSKGHGHGYSHHGHKHRVYHPHKHVEHVIVHDYHDEYYDPFRLLLGLHFDNVDIIYRDY